MSAFLLVSKPAAIQLMSVSLEPSTHPPDVRLSKTSTTSAMSESLKASMSSFEPWPRLSKPEYNSRMSACLKTNSTSIMSASFEPIYLKEKKKKKEDILKDFDVLEGVIRIQIHSVAFGESAGIFSQTSYGLWWGGKKFR